MRNRLAALLGLLAVVLGALFLAAPSQAATPAAEGDPTISVTLVDRSKDNAPAP